MPKSRSLKELRRLADLSNQEDFRASALERKSNATIRREKDPVKKQALQDVDRTLNVLEKRERETKAKEFKQAVSDKRELSVAVKRDKARRKK